MGVSRRVPRTVARFGGAVLFSLAAITMASAAPGGATGTVTVVVDQAVLREVGGECAPFDCTREWEGPGLTVAGPIHWKMHLTHHSTHPCFGGVGTWRLAEKHTPANYLAGTFNEFGPGAPLVMRVTETGGTYAGLVDAAESGTQQNFGQTSPFGCGGPLPVGTTVPAYSGSLRFELTSG